MEKQRAKEMQKKSRMKGRKRGISAKGNDMQIKVSSPRRGNKLSSKGKGNAMMAYVARKKAAAKKGGKEAKKEVKEKTKEKEKEMKSNVLMEDEEEDDYELPPMKMTLFQASLIRKERKLSKKRESISQFCVSFFRSFFCNWHTLLHIYSHLSSKLHEQKQVDMGVMPDSWKSSQIRQRMSISIPRLNSKRTIFPKSKPKGKTLLPTARTMVLKEEHSVDSDFSVTSSEDEEAE